MMDRLGRMGLLALVASLAAGAAMAQFPSERVRWDRSDMPFPQPSYAENRVVIREVRIEGLRVGEGIQITGELWTDFEVVSPPADAPFTAGQMKDLRVTISLYQTDVTLKRDMKNKQGGFPVEVPLAVNATDPVAGQTVTAIVNRVEEGFGTASFALPELTKPLPPGIYKLVASISFEGMTPVQQDALKWCKDWYGAELVLDPVTYEEIDRIEVWKGTKFVEENGQEKRIDFHDLVYKQLLNNLRKIDSSADIYIGKMLRKNGDVNISDKTFVILDPYIQTIGSVLEQVRFKKMIVAQLAAALKGPPVLPRDVQKKKKVQAKEAQANCDRLLARSGGKATSVETRVHTRAFAGRSKMLEDIKVWEERIKQRMWVLLDGVILYEGYHAFYLPGYKMYNAVKTDKNDDAANRKILWQNKIDAAGGEKAYFEKLKANWNKHPAAVFKKMAQYHRNKFKKADWDSTKFTEKDGKEVLMEIDKWSEYRVGHIQDFVASCDVYFDQIDTTIDYAIQRFPRAMIALHGAQEAAIAIAYAWEYQIRVMDEKLPQEELLEEWKREDKEVGEIDLSRYYLRAITHVAGVKRRFDAETAAARRAMGFKQFQYEYAAAISHGARRPGE